MEAYKKFFHVRWDDADVNGHMRNSAYLDLATDIRMLYFRDNAFTARDFERLRVGPVVMKEEIEYFREMKLMDPLEVTHQIAGMAVDGSRFKIRNCFYQQDGVLSVRITSTAGWLDLDLRRLRVPPEPLFTALSNTPRTEDFIELPSSFRG